MKTQRFTEQIDQVLQVVPLTEGTADGAGARRIRAVGVTADVVNGNRRRYRRTILAQAVAELNRHLHESAGQGRLIATGEVEHPSDKSGRPRVLETVLKWETASLSDAGQVLLEGIILPTSKGRDLTVLVDNGVPIGVSMRGYGQAVQVTEGDQTFDDVTELTITGWDLVDIGQRSDPTARILEAQQHQQEGDETMGESKTEPREKEKQEQPAAAEQELKRMEAALAAKEKELAEARKAQEALAANEKELAEARKAQEELAQRKRQDAIEAALAEATQGLPYGELNGQFVDAVRAAQPATPQAVGQVVEAKRKEWDAIFAATKLKAMGKLDVLGPVFEREAGQPEYSRPAFEINESLVKAGQGHRRDLRQAEFGAELFAARYLDLYDRQYRTQLVREARAFEEAESSADLNLPYSVMRAIVQQAFPELVAANIFDFGITDQSPTRLYFERYQGEAGSTASVTDEAITASHDAWVDLAGARLTPGTVVVTNDGGTTTYVEGTDYVVDYGKGQVMALSTGSITDSQALKVDYGYSAIRKGEMQPIERAKQVLSHKMLEIAADRLATQISNEAVVFSRSQLGYDAVTRTLGGLVRQVRTKIDQDIFYLALAASLRQTNNSGGTWTSASDSLDALVQYIGYAKVRVSNRYYEPTGILMSRTTADRLSNWSGFKRDGFPNAVLSAAGYAGSVKGLPIWNTTEFPDTYVLVPNRELVMHRVYQAMQLKGPFPSYQDGKLVAADQYYAEEYNGTDVPVVEKVAHVVIA